MSGFEQAYPSLLQGVSQQIPKLRLDGQVTAQVNMLSDLVTNVRRRPGAILRASLPVPGETHLTMRAWETDIAGQRVHIFLGSATGTMKLLSQDLSTLVATIQNDYLKATKLSSIRATTIGNDFYLLNTEIKPVAVQPALPPLDPTYRGYYYVKAGAFSKSYVVQVKNQAGTVSLTATTPTGQNPGDAAMATPEAIANVLASGANATLLTSIGVSAYVVGSNVYLQSATTGLSVSTGSGSNYIVGSGASRARLESDLPSTLHAAADGYIVAVGEQKLYKYYSYAAATSEWLEAGVWGSPSSIKNMPVVLKYTNSVWSLDTTDYEGRTAGDEDTNPLPEFLTRGLSGMGSFQSRLVLLGGSKVYMSSSAVAKRFMRSTVTGLLDADPIAVGASANSSAEYQYAVPFQKDLLLFSQKYQALIPSSGQAVTPRTASVLLTSAYAVDTTSEPVAIGRTLLFPAPRSQDFFGFMEMVSSQYTDAQYVANDATAHLPKYMGGQCRFATASSVASMVVFGPTGDDKSTIVYEYQWDGDTKVQQAWHTWTFEYPLATSYFSNESINIVMVQNDKMLIVSMDPKQGVQTFAGTRRPFLDNYVLATVVDNKVTVPIQMREFDPLVGGKLKLTVASGDQAGDWVGTTGYDAATGALTTVRSFPNGQVYMGIPYRSTFSPSPPVYRDRNGIKVESNKLTVLRYGMDTKNSTEYRVMVTDDHSEDPQVIEQATLYYSSTELQPGQSRSAPLSRATIPARTDADTTTLLMYTEDVGEFNIVGIDYVGRFNQRLRRR